MIIRDVDSNGFQFRVISVDDFNPEDLGMVQALKARSGETSEIVLNRIYAARRGAFKQALVELDVPGTDLGWAFEQGLVNEDGVLDALMAVASHDDASAQARKLMSAYYVGYGHKSIADCAAGVCLIVEGVSMLCAEALTHHPLYAGQVTSTRAVDFTKAKVVDPIGTTESRAVTNRLMGFYASSWKAEADEVRRRYPRRDSEDEKKYEAAVKSRTFDVLRAWLPAGVTTNVTLTMNLRQLGDHLAVLLLHPLAEVREVALVLQSMLRERYPSSGTFGGAAGVSGVGVDGREAERQTWNKQVAHYKLGPAYQEPKGAAGYNDTLDLAELGEMCQGLLTDRPRGCLLPQWVADLGQVSCRFDLDFGSFRDIQRHRNGVCRMPRLKTNLGFEQWYFRQLPDGLREIATTLADSIPKTIREVDTPERIFYTRQYLTPMGFKVPVSVTYGLPAFVYVVELRSTATVHPTLRRAVLEHMVRPFRAAHPDVRLHVDESEDPWDLRRGQQTIERKLDDGERKS